MATTTNYSWTTPDNTAYVKDGASAIRTLGSSVDTTLFTALGGAYPGLRLIKKQTVGSGVSSVTVTNAFSTTYENYRIVLSNVTTTTDNNFAVTFSGSAGSTYRDRILFTAWGGTSTTETATGATRSKVAIQSNSGTLGFVLDVFTPFLATTTSFTSAGSSVNYGFNANGFDSNAVSHTGFTFTPATGTLTGGTIAVYGYGNS